MSGTRRAPSPLQVGFPLSRRRFLVGAAGVGAALGAGGLLAACGGDDGGSSDDTSGDTSSGTEGGGATGTASGTLTFGSNYSDEVPKNAMAAAIAAFPNKDVTVTINTTDHNTYQENITTYLQQPDDTMCWFAGYRMRFFAAKGLVGDISDVWSNVTELGEGFKTASTGDDGKQYFMPFYYYPWAVHYRKSLFEEKGYEIPKTLAEFEALATQMQSDGLVPIAFGNDGKWPAMGTFDMLNMRINGYQFHVDLMAGKESWTSQQVKDVFAQWEKLLPYFQEGGISRTWQDAAQALQDKTAGMYLLGTFVSEQFTPENLPDLDFFAYPEINPDHAQDAVEAPIDGFMMAKSPKNEAAAKELLAFLGTAPAQEAYLSVNPSNVAASSEADTSGYTALQMKSAELVSGSKYVSQFLDRDTNPEFASNVMGDALVDFISDPGSIDDILAGVQEQAEIILAS
jgi:multiple sugar transport system substrate-binding protein